MKDAVAVRSRVRLVRNFADLPFDAIKNADTASTVISRAASALDSRGKNGFALHILRDMDDENRRALVEGGCIGAELLRAQENGAVLLPADGLAAVLLGGLNHVRIDATRPGLALSPAAEECFRVEDRLSRRASFAFDEQLGYLTAMYAETGTGVRAEVMLHLPLLTREGKLREAGKAAADAGLSLNGAYSPGAEPLGDLWMVSNRMALGRTEQEIIQLVTDAVLQLCEAEETLRQDKLEAEGVPLRDRAWRAMGIMSTARLLTMDEMWRLWSDMRLGAALKLLPQTLERVDALLPQAMTAHLCRYAEETLTGQALDEYRATRVRELLAEDLLE